MLRSPLREVQVGQGHPAVSSPDIKEHDRQQQRYERLVSQGKDLAMKGNVKEALQLYQQALKLQSSDKLERRIARMEEYLKEYGEGEEEEEEDGGDEMAHLGDGFYLYVDLYKQLYSHQREGIRWMWSLYRKKKGGILGDDMGLGKTIQVIAFLAGMFDAQKVHSVLIVLPPAVMVNWEKEFEKWAPGIRVLAFHGGSKKDRERVLNKIHRKGGVCMTTYGMLVNNAPQLAEREGREYVWDYIILDEGHKIKNPSIKCSKGVHAIAARHRLILTGTPIQNNLKEMWALFNWTHQGTLLGTAKTFAMEYEGPITRARQKDATAGEQRLGSEIANSLQKIINPFFLRRTKASVAKKEKENRKDKTDGEEAEPSNDKKAPSMPTLSRKNDLIVWTHLSEAQQQIYQDFLDTPDVAMLLNTSKSPLTGLMVLKKICDHPRLLTTVQCHQLGIEIPDSDTIAHEDSEQGKQCAASHIHGVSNNMLMGESGKLQFLVLLLNNLRDTGHRCLVFSQSRKMLDIIQKILREKGHKVARLDGTIRHLQEREQIIGKFTKDKSYNVFLLTTQVGGVGLTLTAADRVVIFDPSWNPATDAQAVDRAFRIGQQKNVVIYRLITCGTVEEKIYRRQIFKDSITKQTTGDSKNPYRYFSRQELHELFVLDNPRHSTTQEQLNSLYEGKRHTDISLDEHIAFLHSLDIFGLSDHDLMFSQEAVQDSDEEPESGEYISQRVNRAQTLISMESDNNMASTDSNGRFQAPEVFREPKENRPLRTQNWQPPALGGPSPGTLIDLTAAESHNTSASPESSHHDSEEEEEEEVESEEEEMEQGSPVKNAPRPPVVTSPEKPADLSVALHDLTIEEDESEDGDQDESQIRSPTPPPGVQASKHSSEIRQHEDTEESMESDDRSQDEYADTVSESPSSYRPQQNLNGSMQIPDSPLNTDDENIDIPGSPVNKKAKQTQKHETPKSGQASMKKKRRSVCVTPGRANVFMSDPAALMSPAAGPVVEESIVLSPEAYDPLVKTLPVVCSTSSLAGYESFIKPLGGAANSTVLDRPSPTDHDKHSLSFVEETPETSLVDSPPPTMMKTKRAMVIHESDDDDDDADSDNKPYQPIDVSDYLSESEEESTTEHSGNDQEDAEGVMETDEEHDVTENGRNKRSSMQKSEQKSITRNNDSLKNTSSRELTGHRNSDASYTRSAKTSLPVVNDSDTEEMGDDEAEEDAEQDDEDEVEEEEVEEEEESEEDGEDEEEAEEDGEDEEDESEEEEEEGLTEEQQERYIHLMKKCRTLAKSNQFLEALQFCLEALDIYSGDERARAYAVKLQRKLQM